MTVVAGANAQLQSTSATHKSRAAQCEHAQLCNYREKAHTEMPRVVRVAAVDAHGFASTASMTSDKSFVSAAIRRKFAINAVQT